MAHRYLTNRDNLVAAGTVVADAVIPSQDFRPQSVSQAGGGAVRLTGDYTGQSDQVFEVEVTSDTVNTPRTSSPVFSGVGSSEMTQVAAASGTAAQQITVTLVDTGTPELTAALQLAGVRLVAAQSGAVGNLITLSVDQSGLLRADTDFSTLASIPADTEELVGDEWDWGHVALAGDGTIPSNAPRVAFAGFPDVYRLYKTRRDGEDVFKTSPVIRRDIPQDTPVQAVSGDRTVTITDGTSPENYTAIQTLYDLLSAIEANSALVAVDGVAVQDRTPGGMAINDLTVFTSPTVSGIVGDGTRFVEEAARELDLTPDASAPTETLKLTVDEVPEVGDERWRVEGTQSGVLARAITGQLYAVGPYQFTIPVKEPLNTEPSGNIEPSIQLKQRSADEQLPGVKFERALLGAQALDAEYTFSWQPRPPEACDPAQATVTGRPDPDCLGIEELEDVMAQTTLAPRLQVRLERLMRWRNDFVIANAALDRADSLDIQLANRATRALGDALVRLDGGVLDYPGWEADSVVSIGDLIQADGYRRMATTAGTTGSTEPTWTNTLDASTSDGGVTWKTIGLNVLALWDSEFADLQDALNTATSVLAFEGGVSKGRNWPDTDTVLEFVLTSERFVANPRNGWWYQVFDALHPNETNFGDVNVLSAPGSGWPTGKNETASIDGGSNTDSNSEPQDISVRAISQYWKPSTSVGGRENIEVLVDPGGLLTASVDLTVYESFQDGTTGTAEPDWGNAEVTDNTVDWLLQENSAGEFNVFDPAIVDGMVQRYTSAAAEVVTAAGLRPNFDDASTVTGGRCWQDQGDAFWFAPEDSSLLPIFANHYYHSAKRITDGNGAEDVVSTKEFGIRVRVGCVDKLKIGDKVTIKISGVANSLRTYQQGDQIEARIIRRTPKQWGGGQDGDNIETWSVSASVDGALPDYQLDRDAPALYSQSGHEFLITPGGIPDETGAQWKYFVEGGEFRWRVDGGTWQGPLDIDDTVTLQDGVSGAFDQGAAPSFVVGDTWAIQARAVNGADRLQSPQPGSLRTNAAGNITLTHQGPIDAIALLGHDLPAGATLRLQGSDDGFSNTPLDLVVPVRELHLYHELDTPADHAEYRLVTDRAVAIRWWWAGAVHTFDAINGHIDAQDGALTKEPALGDRNAIWSGAGVGYRIEHDWLSQADVDWLLDLQRTAQQNDRGLIAIAPVADDSEASLGTVSVGSVTEPRQFATQGDDRLIASATVTLDPVLL